MTKAWIMTTIVGALALGSCKKDKLKEPPRPTAPAPTTAPAPMPAPTANAGDCKSIKEFTTVAACVAQCAGGDANACFVAGSSYQVGDKTDEDEPKAVEYLTKGCNMGSPDACWWGGSMYRNGDGMAAPNPEMATDMYQKGRKLFGAQCEAKDAKACYELAGMMESGWGAAADVAAAKAMYKKACDLGHQVACERLSKF